MAGGFMMVVVRARCSLAKWNGARRGRPLQAAARAYIRFIGGPVEKFFILSLSQFGPKATSAVDVLARIADQKAADLAALLPCNWRLTRIDCAA
jgi:hypothetical protein